MPSSRRLKLRPHALLLLVPGVAIAAFDVRARAGQIASWPAAAIALWMASLVVGAVLWAALVAAASSRAWTARAVALLLLAAGSSMAIGAQAYFFGRYHAYLNPRAVLVGTSMLPSVGQQLWNDRASFLGAIAPPLAIAIGLPLVYGRTADGSRTPHSLRAWDIAVAALLVSLFVVRPTGGEQSASPDVLYLASMGRLAQARWHHDAGVETVHPGPRTPSPVAAIGSAPRPRRSLLFFVTESVRATDYCSTFSADCAVTPLTNALAPDRFGFSQMRALDSTTAVSLAVLWSGLPPTASREALHTAPLLWEYARAAGYDTAYWTSQNMFFANSGTWLESVPLTQWVSATDLDADPTFETGADDAKLVDAVIAGVPKLRAPFVGVVHLSNTHFPYVIDESDAPFQPEGHAFGSGDAATLHNRYRDSIHRQDAQVARLLRAVRAIPGGQDVVVAFVSDHGEQIRERGAIGHTWGVYDEEVRVPFWIDAPSGALNEGEAAAMRTLADAPLTQLDVLPTLLDLMGVWDAPEIARFRAAMAGGSLLRGGTPGRAAVLTNCSAIFACAFKNWGAMRATRKLVATQNDSRWRCFDVADDPYERTDLGLDACGADLRALAEGGGRGTPF